MIKAIIAATTILLITSCAGLEDGLGPKPQASIYEVRSQLSATPSCCKDFSEFSYIPFQPTKAFEFKIHKTDKSYRFNDGLSFYKALSLPAYNGPYSLILRSYYIRGGHHYFKDGYVFHPTVLLLNAKYQPIQIFDAANFRFGEEKFALSKNFNVEGNLYIANAEAKYMVIYTTEAQQQTTTSTNVSQTDYTGMTWKDSYEVPHSPVGEFKLEIIKY